MNVPIEVIAEIVERVHRDQSFASTVTNHRGYSDEMRKIHEDNAQFLEETLKIVRLDELMSVSKEIADAVFLIIQHAISLPSFMKEMLVRLSVGPSKHPLYAAYIEDRIHYFERQPQRYGTQYDYNEQGQMSMYWCTDSIEMINQRRALVGMNTVQENEQRFIHQPALAPDEVFHYVQDQHEWLIRTGWCTQEMIEQYQRRNR